MTMRKFFSKRLGGRRGVNNNDRLKKEESDARMQRILEKNKSILAILEQEDEEAIIKNDGSTRTTSTEKDEQEEVEMLRMTKHQEEETKSAEDDDDSDSLEFPPIIKSSALEDSMPELAHSSNSSSFTASANSSMGLSVVFDQKVTTGAALGAPSDRSATKNNNSGSSSDRSVSFDKLTIRRFSTTIIENPSVSAGPAITLAWDSSAPSEEWSVEDYEAISPSQERPIVKALSSHDRHELLLDNGLTATEIRQAVSRTNKLRKQRSQTARKFEVKNGGGKVARLLRVKEQMRKNGTL